MKISWYGQSLFRIKTRTKGRNKAVIVIDPFDKKVGLKVPKKLKADILLVTHQHHDHNNIEAVSGNPFLIEEPGEYEIETVFIQGLSSFHDDKKGEENGRNTIYIIENEGMKVCHLGGLGQKELTDRQLEKIGDIDILMIPIGGGKTVSPNEASEIISQLEPKIVIPMHYDLPGLKMNLQPLKKFLKTFGIKEAEPKKILSVKKKSLPQEETKIVVLKA